MFQVFQAWRVAHVATRVKGLEATNQALKIQVKRPMALSATRKPELVELAFSELEMPQQKAKGLLVKVLRAMIRQVRRQRQVAAYDPMAHLPAGLTKMKKAYLQKECERR